MKKTKHKPSIRFLSAVALMLLVFGVGCTRRLPSGPVTGSDGGEEETPEILNLSAFSFSVGTLTPPFDADVTEYELQLPFMESQFTLAASTEDPEIVLTYEGSAISSGDASPVIAVEPGETKEVSFVLSKGSFSRTYTFSVIRKSSSEFIQQAYLKASDSDTGDLFGSTVAMSGNTLVVGAPAEASNAVGIGGDDSDDSAAGTGAVYVFVRSGSVWTQQAYLKASNAQAGDSFGVSVDIDGDTLVVGATGERSSATGVNGNQTNNGLNTAGAAYVFTRTGTTWTQQAYLKASNTGIFDQFGYDVAVSEDTIAVSAVGEDSDATGINGDAANNDFGNAGAVYVFSRTGTTWTQQAYVKASNTGMADEFGHSLDIDGDTLVVGARSEDSNATGIGGNQADNSEFTSGAVYVFTRSGLTWSQQSYIKSSNSEDGDEFGKSVSLSGDTLVVGAIGERSNATGIDGDENNNDAALSGAAYVFTRNGGVWSQQAYLKASNSGASDQFGTSIALVGESVLVGAPGESSPATGVNGNGAVDTSPNSGAVYLFGRIGTTWSQLAYLKASNTDDSDAFGTSVALVSDTIAVGATGEASSDSGVDGDEDDDTAASAGAVYLLN